MSGSRRKPGPLGPFVDGYRVWLAGRGYSPPVVVRSLGTLGHLGRWLERNALTVEQLTDEAVSGFVAEYRDDRGRLPGASVWPLLEYLRADGAVPPEPPTVVAPVDELVGEYRQWLLRERGLAPGTVRACEQFARRFLARRVDTADLRGVLAITAGEVNAFMLRECARVSNGSAACCTYRLRSLLRYLALRGFADHGLAIAVPRVARWREATIPQFPRRPQIDRLLGSCDRDNATGARDYAVLLLLARLGLRAVEVSRLRLDDLDWRAGLIAVDGKAHRRDQLPLPSDVGAAIVNHLRHRGRRPGERRVFLTVHAPVRPLEPSGVRTIVRNACRRARVEPVPAHGLRHALASDLLRGGSVDGRRRPGAAPPAPGEHGDLRQGRPPTAPPRRLPVAGSAPMTTFAEHVDDYLRLRRGLGFKLEEHARLLAKFATHLDATGAEVVTVDLALAWAVEPVVAAGSVAPAMRLLVVRGFARYLAGLDPRTEVPPSGLIPLRRQRRPPFIYSDEQILTLMEQARTAIRQRLVAATYETLIGLLAATGMRISEATKLDDADIDWQEGVLLVRQSKFNKSRYLPLHASALDALEHYAHQRERLCPNPREPSFFVSLRRRRLDQCAVHATFRRLCAATGVGAGASVLPRLHDLRHTMAVKTLLGWYREGVDVHSRLPALSTYLGHLSPAYTYYYLSAAPQLLAHAAEMLDGAQEGRS